MNIVTNLARIFAVIACFVIPSLGTAAINISIGLAALFALFCIRPATYRDLFAENNYLPIGLLLFVWLGISLFWSDNGSISDWLKYREFLLLPLFVWCFSEPHWQRYGVLALFSGLLLACLITFLVYFDLSPTSSKFHSLGNHIFHGVTLSFFAYLALIAAERHRKFALFFIASFIAAFICVFLLREGRTGFILFATLVFLFIIHYVQWRVYKWHLMGIAIAVIALITYLMLLDLNTSTDFDLIDTPLSLDYLAQLDIRFEYYLNTFILVLENGLFGVGLGDFSSVYRQIITEHFNYWGMTDNPHNEYLMIISQTGVIGLILFLWFLAALLKQARHTNSISLGALLVVLISCLFNSSFLDNNDGAFLLIIIALFISSVKKTASISDEA